MEPMTEVFMPIYESEGRYEISNLGRVRSLYFHGKKRAAPKILKPGLSHGYWSVVFCVDGVRKTFFVHKLLAIYFIPNLKKRREVNHKDGNRSNNDLNNLEWCTHRENMVHSKVVLNKANGCMHPKSLFNIVEIQDILKRRFKGKESAKEIAGFYNCSDTAITNICAGRRYRKEYKALKNKQIANLQ